MCVRGHRSGSGLGLTLHCPAQPGDSEQRSYKDIDFPPSFPERDQMSSRSDTSLTFQWGFLVCLYPVFLFYFFIFLRTGSLIVSLFLATCISLALAPQNKEGTHWLSVPADCSLGILGSKNARGLEIGGGVWN